MAVIIDCMTMPEECSDCEFICWEACGKYQICMFTNEMISGIGRRKDCPLREYRDAEEDDGR